MYKHNIHTGNTLLIGIVAMVAAAVLALAALSFAGETWSPEKCTGMQEGTADYNCCMSGSMDSDACKNMPTHSQPAPSDGAQQGGGQDGDKCSQIHSYQGGDRCEKERMLLQYGCVQDISPECKGGGSGYQSGPGAQGGGKRIDVQNGIATCYDEEGRWTQDQECQKAAGTYHEPGQQQWGNQSGWTPHESAGSGPMPPMYQMDRQDHRGGQPQYHGGPSMGPGGYNMGQGGFPGMGRDMMGGPGGSMGDRCEMFDDIIDEMKSRLTEMDEETADRWSEMEDHMREKAADQIDRLRDKMEDTDDAKKIAKYEKQIAKVEAKIEKQIAKMKARFEKQAAKMKARMEKEIAKLEEKAAECEDHESEGGDFGGGEWGGDMGTMAPSFGPGGGNPYGGY